MGLSKAREGGQPLTSDWFCRHCPKTFSTEGALHDHLLKVHDCEAVKVVD